MDSGQLSGLQKLVSLLRNLGIVLPLLALLLYVGALYLAKGWRREALIAAGGGIVVATIFILLLRRLIGNGVDSVAASDTVKPAITSVWEILSAGLRQRALFVLAIGIAFIGGGATGGARAPRGRGAALPRSLPARSSGRRLRRRGRCASCSGSRSYRGSTTSGRSLSDRRARRAGRGGHRDPAPAGGAGVSPRREWFITKPASRADFRVGGAARFELATFRPPADVSARSLCPRASHASLAWAEAPKPARTRRSLSESKNCDLQALLSTGLCTGGPEIRQAPGLVGRIKTCRFAGPL